MELRCKQCEAVIKRRIFCDKQCYSAWLRQQVQDGAHVLPHIRNPPPKGANRTTWKGNNVDIKTLHKWVYQVRGRPDTCEHCGRKGIALDWASKSRTYQRDSSDWLRLCKSCHYKYDDIGQKMWATRKGLKYAGNA